MWRGRLLLSAPNDPQGNALDALQDRLGIRFQRVDLLRTALVHSSYSNEHPDDAPETNERLEFLGDAVLGLVVAETLYARYPEVGEGRLTEWRAQLVMGPTLARVAESLDLGSALLLGRGEEATGGRVREGNLERAYEAVVGALSLDQGLDAAREFLHRTLALELETLESGLTILNPKGELQQLLQESSARPDYVTVAEEGPEHDRRFTVEVRIGGEPVGVGIGGSKQLAEKEAARQALIVLRTRSAGRGQTPDEADELVGA
jgi:ribonuclease-3